MSQNKPKDIQEAISRMAALIAHMSIEFNNMVDFLAEQGVDVMPKTPPPQLDTAFLDEQLAPATTRTELSDLIASTTVRVRAQAEEMMDEHRKRMVQLYPSMGTFYSEKIVEDAKDATFKGSFVDAAPLTSNRGVTDTLLSEAEVAAPQFGEYTMAFIHGKDKLPKPAPFTDNHHTLPVTEAMHGLQGINEGTNWTIDNLGQAGAEGKEVVDSTVTSEAPKASPLMQSHVFTSVQNVEIPDVTKLHGDAKRLFEKAQELMMSKASSPVNQENVNKIAGLIDADNPVSQIAAALILPTIGTTIGDQPGYENEAGVQFKPKDLLSAFKAFDESCFGKVRGIFTSYFTSEVVEAGVGTIGFHPVARTTGVARYREDILSLPLAMTANFPMGIYLNHLSGAEQLYIPSDFPKNAEHKIAFVVENFNNDDYTVYFSVPGAKNADAYTSIDEVGAAHGQTLFLAMAETLKKIHAENMAVLYPK